MNTYNQSPETYFRIISWFTDVYCDLACFLLGVLTGLSVMSVVSWYIPLIGLLVVIPSFISSVLCNVIHLFYEDISHE